MKSFYIFGIDWNEFKQSKLALIRARHNETVDEKDQQRFEGLLNLMDHIQDQAAKEHPEDEDIIYLSELELNQDNIDHDLKPDFQGKSRNSRLKR